MPETIYSASPMKPIRISVPSSLGPCRKRLRNVLIIRQQRKALKAFFSKRLESPFNWFGLRIRSNDLIVRSLGGGPLSFVLPHLLRQDRQLNSAIAPDSMLTHMGELGDAQQ